ncbi:L-aspartate oxidase [Frondihabitans sp. 762G35]|uniref:L-aspartate oxidase n=1 Tax=Frondihabitans sp. 762G35 TaxID=1446794 RepID=UPI000D2160DC|nr:L-aspartate oxidase [Frondihabitans sp. 762G35]ARC57772.1 L-aspartate oxidase [Frondihabitans sp. 762G35]
MTRILVAGSGLAGLTTALRAEALGHDVTLVAKGGLDDSNSRWAQGGIAAAVFSDDAPALHAADTLSAGAGLSAAEAVDVLCTEGPDRIADLVRWGVAFDRDGDDWARGLEAAHGRARVLHAGGDATGLAIVSALIERLRESRVTVLEHAFVADLLVVEGRVPRVTGVELLLDGIRREVEADAVVLATGGAGQLYAHTTNPAGATGDGLAAAWRAGARVDDVEFYQFHPTALALPGSFLVSEAVRGEGAVLLDAGGRRFMAGVDRRAELAPRDVVARGIAAMMRGQAGHPALLDATGIGADRLVSRFPTITAATRAAGLDWTREPIPVTPAAHYFMGGVSTDLFGRSSLDGLYAVGEVASTGVHGANRLASNSLLEAAVFGWRAVEAISVDAPQGVSGGAVVPRDASSGAVLSRDGLQRLLWESAGVERSGDPLRQAQEVLARASVDARISCVADEASDTGSAAATRGALETANLLDVGRLVVRAALAREESRGAHFRSDFPHPSDDHAHSLEWAREVPQHAH